LRTREPEYGYDGRWNLPFPPARFTGKERDAETGLDYFGARYLSSAQGRFTSVDPIQYSRARVLDPQQWNMYAYARGNPVGLTDPTGAYNTSCKSKDITQCGQDIQTFESNRQKDLKSQSANVRKAAKAYGSFNDGNNVTVKFDPNLKNGGEAEG
jgi:RHS repeat-associated protein